MTKKRFQITLASLETLNDLRVKNGKVKYMPEWSGLKWWLRTDEKEYKQVGRNLTFTDETLDGFIEALLLVERNEYIQF